MLTTASRRVRVLAAGVLLVASGALTACSAHPGQAAVAQFIGLDGTQQEISVSEKDLDGATSDLVALGWTRDRVLNGLLQAPVYFELAEKYGLSVPDTDVDTILSQINPEASSFSEGARTIARLSSVSAQLQGLGTQEAGQVRTDFAAMAESFRSTPSPRYTSERPWEIQDASALSLGGLRK
ncbi:hypothetical protein [Actinomyces faecalis]|uniref:hypothetical protein n=1 Tax=Actinomyces faecalis TaxID=2722820 RepID=UPI0015573F91|nr:hypothetical protein [Actinomyces faecalis]